MQLEIYHNDIFTAIQWNTPEDLKVNLAGYFKEKKMWQFKDKPLRWFKICHDLVLKFGDFQREEEIENGNLTLKVYEVPEQLIEILKRIDALEKLSLIEKIPDDIVNEETLDEVDNVLASVMIIESIK